MVFHLVEVREDKELMQKEASGTSLECPGGCIVFPLIVQWADKNINDTRPGFIRKASTYDPKFTIHK